MMNELEWRFQVWCVIVTGSGEYRAAQRPLFLDESVILFDVQSVVDECMNDFSPIQLHSHTSYAPLLLTT